VLQCVAVYCKMLRCCSVAVCRSVLNASEQHLSIYAFIGVLRCGVVCCSVAVCCSVLNTFHQHCFIHTFIAVLQCVAVYCSMLWCARCI